MRSEKLIDEALSLLPNKFEWNILRIERNRISFLNYPDFDSNPHPSLSHALTVDLKSRRTKLYISSKLNPPVLHRKETFIHPSNPGYRLYHELTIEEEKAGLLDSSIVHKIGHKKQWEQLLETKGFQIVDHRLKSKLAQSR
jgi:DNA phosphorothioation-associated putative methyltransferase